MLADLTRSLCLILAGCLGVCAAMPPSEALQQAEAAVLESLRHELGALELGRRTRSDVAAFATNRAEAATSVAEKCVYLQGAFRLYALDGKMDEALAALRRQRTVVSDCPLPEFVRQIDGVLALLPPDRSPRLRHLRDGLELRIRYREELPGLLEKVRKAPCDAGLNIELAHHHAVLDEWEQAMEAFAASGCLDKNDGVLGFTVTETASPVEPDELSVDTFDRVGRSDVSLTPSLTKSRKVGYAWTDMKDPRLAADFWWTYAEELPRHLRECFRAFASCFLREAESVDWGGTGDHDLDEDRDKLARALGDFGRPCVLAGMPPAYAERDDAGDLLGETGRVRFVHGLCRRARLDLAFRRLSPRIGECRDPEFNMLRTLPAEIGADVWRERSQGQAAQVKERIVWTMKMFERGRHRTACGFVASPSPSNDCVLMTFRREVSPGEVVLFPMLEKNVSCPVVFSGEPGWDVARFERHEANGLVSYRIPAAFSPDATTYGFYILHDGKYEDYTFTREVEEVDVGQAVREMTANAGRTSGGGFICRFPVSQWIWQLVMGDDPSIRKGPFYPVENVSWNDCQAFIGKLNGLEEVRRRNLVFRLPLEKELGESGSEARAACASKWIWCRDDGNGRRVLSFGGVHRSWQAPDFKAHYTGLVLTAVERRTGRQGE